MKIVTNLLSTSAVTMLGGSSLDIKSSEWPGDEAKVEVQYWELCHNIMLNNQACVLVASFPGSPNLFNVREKRGGAWDAKSRD